MNLALLILVLVLPMGKAEYVPVTLCLLPPSGPFGYRPMTPAWEGLGATVDGEVLTLGFGAERLSYRILERVALPDGRVYLRLTDGRSVLLRRR